MTLIVVHSMNVTELKKLFDEYLLTLDDEEENEAYKSDRRFASDEIENFLEWLDKRAPIVGTARNADTEETT